MSVHESCAEVRGQWHPAAPGAWHGSGATGCFRVFRACQGGRACSGELQASPKRRGVGKKHCMRHIVSWICDCVGAAASPGIAVCCASLKRRLCDVRVGCGHHPAMSGWAIHCSIVSHVRVHGCGGQSPHWQSMAIACDTCECMGMGAAASPRV